MLWTIQEVTRSTGLTSRTLRHYDRIGLLPPSATGPHGYRQYDEAALTRLQRILVLRQLGVPLRSIAAVLAGEADDLEALRELRTRLREEVGRLDRQLRSIERTIEKREGGETLMAEEMFDGFDHTQHRQEVEERWGAEAYRRSDQWWRNLGDEGQKAFQAEESAIRAGLTVAREAGLDAASAEAQEWVGRHHEWVAAAWGAHALSDEAYLGLGDMYVADPRFAKHYGGPEGAEYLRAAMQVYSTRTGTRP